MTKLSIQDIKLKDKTVLMRVDFNVPLDENGKITDDTRIKAALPTIEYALNHDAKIILMSHLGRPKTKKDLKFSLAPIAKRLSELLNKPIIMANDCIGENVKKMVFSLISKDILLLENLRFYEAEENPDLDPSFAKELASYGEIYVNNAFGAAHRNHSSITAITKYFPQKAVSGFLLDKEIAFLSTLANQPKRPFYAIIGGSKISSKMGVVKNLIEKVDSIFIGGGMAYTFLKAQGITLGKSIIEEDQIENAKYIINRCTEKAVKFYLPVDLIIANNFSNEAESKIISIKDSVNENWQGMSIGPKTVEEWGLALQSAATVFWNGPLGVFEFSNFAKATRDIADVLSNLNATTIVGGGDSVAAINQAGLGEKFTHLSTGGGASLEYLEFGHLPGVDALCER
jgi:phosphoglycerate kinase